MSIVIYLDLCYDYVVHHKISVGVTYMLTYIAHVLHRIANTIKKHFPNLMKIKHFLIDCVSLIFLCRDISEVDMLFEDFLKILLTKDKVKAEQGLLFFTGKKAEKTEDMDRLGEKVKLIEQTIDELEIQNEYEILYHKNKAVYVHSKFYKRCYTKFVRIDNTFEEEKMLDDITNEFYAPEFAEYFTIDFMTYIPICGSLMLDSIIDVDISRVSNAYVESHNKVMKIDVMNRQKKNSMGQAIRKLKEYVNFLIAEANLGSSAHTKSKINGPKKPRYPDTPSNPFVKDVWRRGIQSGKRRENDFEGQEIQRIVERVIASMRKAQGSDDEEINVPKVQKVGPLPKRRKRMQRMTKKNLIMESNKNKERIIPSKKSQEGRKRANVITTQFIKQKRGKFLINKNSH